MIFGRKQKRKAEIERKEKENLESYLSFFPENKMKFQYEPFILELAGARHYKNDNLGYLFAVGEQVLLFQEPENTFDKNAVKVVNLRGQQIGYIPKEDACNIGSDLENGHYYKVTIDSIVDDLIYPYISLELVRHSDKEEVKISEEELNEFWEKREKEKQEREENFSKAFELSQKGREFENEGLLTEAMENYEKSIKYKEAPPIAFERLAIYFRNQKDFDNEIRVINKWLEIYIDSEANELAINSKTEKIKKRLNKAIELKNKSKN
jgi:hypothetical protein